jgi:alkanesulfonate monooxygenase SsuD/methylene tetrahydromethanopterin reductase-like flavin-dependent oxidoreductase (luciferase family)
MDLVALSLLPLHNPVAIAEEMTTLAAMSEGHVVLAAALGYREIELRAFGVDPNRRVARFNETLELIKRLWKDEEVEHMGAFFEIPSTPIHTRPESGREPSVWVAASSEPAVRRAARGGYTWLIEPASHLNIVAQQRSMYDESFVGDHQAAPPGVAIIREVLVDENAARAREVAGPTLVSKYATYRQLGHAESISPDEDFATGFAELAEGRFIVGSPAECIDSIVQIGESLPVDWLFVHSHWPGFSYEETLRSLRLFAEKVMPAL